MSKKIFKSLCFFISYVVISGCATSKVDIPKYEVKAYLQDKPRVDQQINGNAGYLIGKPPKKFNTNRKRTRKIFVVKITEEDSLSPYLINMDEGSKNKNIRRKKTSFNSYAVSYKKNQKSQSRIIPVYSSKIQIPSFDDVTETDTQDKNPHNTTVAKIVNYKVEKDDTLQKISKKFYGCYSKWPKIYKANKSKIKDPNFLKPGIILKIPMN